MKPVSMSSLRASRLMDRRQTVGRAVPATATMSAWCAIRKAIAWKSRPDEPQRNTLKGCGDENSGFAAVRWFAGPARLRAGDGTGVATGHPEREALDSLVVAGQRSG